MATFTQITELNDQRVADYLYELNENLSYMFNNLSPEDNYSENARLIYVQRGKRLSSLEVRADAIELRVRDDETNYNTSMQLFSNLLKLTANTPTGSSTIALTGDKIELTTGKFIVNSKNLTIDAQGNAEFSGTVRAAQVISSAISGGTITGTSINGGDSIKFKARPGYLQFGDFVIDDNSTTDGRQAFMAMDESTGISGESVEGTGRLYLWAGYGGGDDEDYSFLVNGHGQTHVNGEFWYNGEELYDLIYRIVEEMTDSEEEP